MDILTATHLLLSLYKIVGVGVIFGTKRKLQHYTINSPFVFGTLKLN